MLYPKSYSMEIIPPGNNHDMHSLYTPTVQQLIETRANITLSPTFANKIPECR
jgi:hypothetical protein